MGTRTTRSARPSKSIATCFGPSGFVSSFFGSSFLGSSFLIVTSSLSGGNGCATSLRSARAKIPVVRLAVMFHSRPFICGANSRSEKYQR